MTKIKICGITTEEEVEFLNTLKVDYIGFVFAESKRKITPKEGERLSEKVGPSISKVGVFKGNSIEEITTAIDRVSLDVVQLHEGNLINEYIKAIRAAYPKVEIWRGINTTVEVDKVKKNNGINKYVLDGNVSGAGETWNWNIDISALKDERIFLAGGLNSGNVIDGIEKLKPYGVDVSSGVEEVSEGLRRKTYSKVKEFVERVREYDKR